VTDIDNLLAAVLAEPECDVVRGAYADALEENGQAERAEFIRLSIELNQRKRARMPADEPCTCRLEGLPRKRANGGGGLVERLPDSFFDNIYCKACTRRTKGIEQVGRRAWELFKAGCREWFGERLVPYGDSVQHDFRANTIYGNDQEFQIDLTRGFIHTVRGQLDVLRDGECGCENGGVDTGGTTPWGAPISVRCEECQGTGRTPGILRELVRREPVEVVEVVDKEPEQLGSGRFMWAHEGNLHNSDDPEEAKIPDALFWKMARMDGTHYTDDPDIRCRWLWIDTRELARAALSNALLAEAKGPVPA